MLDALHCCVWATSSFVLVLCSTGVKTSHWSRYGATTAADRAALGDGQDNEDTMLGPDHIAETYLFVHRQHRSAWTFEMVLRPWVETW